MIQKLGTKIKFESKFYILQSTPCTSSTISKTQNDAWPSTSIENNVGGLRNLNVLCGNIQSSDDDETPVGPANIQYLRNSN